MASGFDLWALGLRCIGRGLWGWSGINCINERDNMKTKHISQVRAGDTVRHNGKEMTVCNKDLKRGFCGLTMFGDSYRLGTRPVEMA